jgi:predicted Ser/Thr protein kinase
MSTPTDPIDALIASYVQAIEAGRVPNRRDLLDQNPDHAEALQTFFADFDRMDRVAAPLRIANESDETAAIEGLGTAHPPTLRYFGDYELLEEIARGGMGLVYKARQTSLNRLVALKMILAGTFATPREVARFQAEAEAAANLDHPQIVPVYEVGEHEGQQYFSMKFIEGTSLANHPRNEPKAEVLGLIKIARAVHHAHQHGVLHRDLKPSNVLVDPRGESHVTDFGLAKRLTDLDRSLTEAGQILGTPRYMSPEQAAGRKDLTVATDVYSLGVILYERLTGRTPFQANNVVALLHQVRESDPARPSTIRPGLDRDLETITLKCLEKDPAQRYSTADDLAQDLSRWHEGRPIAARPVGQTERFVRWCRRNPVVAGLTAAVMVSLIIGTAVSAYFASKANERAQAEIAQRNRVSDLLLDAQHKLIDADVDKASPLEFAQIFRRALDDPKGQDLRWYILSSLAAWTQGEIGGIYPLLINESDINGYTFGSGTVVTACSDGTLSLWEIATGRLLARRKTQEFPVSEMAISPAGDRLLTIVKKSGNPEGSAPRTVTCRLWQIPSLEPVGEPFPPKSVSSELAWDHENMSVFSPRGNYVAVCLCQDLDISVPGRFRRNITLWDTRTGEKRSEIPLEYEDDRPIVYSIVFWSPDETRILEGETKAMYDVSSGRLLYRVALNASTFPHISMHGQELAELFSDEETIRFRNPTDGRPVNGIAEIKNEGFGDANSIEFSPTGRFLTTNKSGGPVVMGYSSTSELWVHQGMFRREDGKRVLNLAHERIKRWLDNDKFVYTDKRTVYDSETGERVKPEPGRAYPILVETESSGRFFLGDDLDARTGKRLGLYRDRVGSDGNPASLIRTPGGYWMLQQEQTMFTRSFIPDEPITNDPDIVKLWAEVVSLHESDPRGGPDIELGSEVWDERRRKLALMLPSDVSPILKTVAEDRSFYYRKNSGAKNPRLDSIRKRYGEIVERPGASPESYREALDKIREVYEIYDINGSSRDDRESCFVIPNQIGMAQYRCGLFLEAIATLTKSHGSPDDQESETEDPTELAVLAMSRARLGQVDAARVTLAKLERIMKESNNANEKGTASDRAFLREAQELILDHGFPTNPFSP